MTGRRTLAFAILALGALLSLLGPRVRPRQEEKFLRVEVTARGAMRAGTTVVLRVAARNEHTARRRVYVSAIDVSESLGAIGRVTAAGEVPAKWIPIARAWRIPWDVEVVPGKPLDTTVRIHDVKPGTHDGFVDVVLDGSTWVRTPVTLTIE